MNIINMFKYLHVNHFSCLKMSKFTETLRGTHLIFEPTHHRRQIGFQYIGPFIYARFRNNIKTLRMFCAFQSRNEYPSVESVNINSGRIHIIRAARFRQK